MLTVNTSPIAQAIVGGKLLENELSLLARQRAGAGGLHRATCARWWPAWRRRFPDPASGVRWNVPAGGFFVVVTVPFAVDDALLERSAADYGVLWTPMHHFYEPGVPVHALRLSCSTVTPEQIEPGLDRVARLIHDQLGHRGAGGSAARVAVAVAVTRLGGVALGVALLHRCVLGPVVAARRWYRPRRSPAAPVRPRSGSAVGGGVALGVARLGHGPLSCSAGSSVPACSCSRWASARSRSASASRCWASRSVSAARSSASARSRPGPGRLLLGGGLRGLGPGRSLAGLLQVLLGLDPLAFGGLLAHPGQHEQGDQGEHHENHDDDDESAFMRHVPSG